MTQDPAGAKSRGSSQAPLQSQAQETGQGASAHNVVFLSCQNEDLRHHTAVTDRKDSPVPGEGMECFALREPGGSEHPVHTTTLCQTQLQAPDQSQSRDTTPQITLDAHNDRDHSCS